MSDDLIRRIDVYKAVDDWVAGRVPNLNIKDIPSVDRPKGEWILDPNGMDWNLPAWRCSRCGAKNDNIGVVAKGIANNPYRWAGSKFCPQCGCEMRAKENNDEVDTM